MSDMPAHVAPGETAEARPRVVVRIERVHLTYKVFEDARPPSLKRSLASRGRSRSARTVEAVTDVSFDIHEGEAVGLIGRNGAGKSTLLRAVAGLLPVREGRILARSEPVLLGVAAALHPELSGRRNIYLGCTALGMTRDEVDATINDIVQFADLEDFIEMPLRTYSSGMAARLRFAVASAVRPDILLIDEALSVGDARFQKRSSQRIRELQQHAGAVVLVSHSMNAVRGMCSRVVWLDAGRVLADGPAESVVEEYLKAQ